MHPANCSGWMPSNIPDVWEACGNGRYIKRTLLKCNDSSAIKLLRYNCTDGYGSSTSCSCEGRLKKSYCEVFVLTLCLSAVNQTSTCLKTQKRIACSANHSLCFKKSTVSNSPQLANTRILGLSVAF